MRLDTTVKNLVILFDGDEVPRPVAPVILFAQDLDTAVGEMRFWVESLNTPAIIAWEEWQNNQCIDLPRVRVFPRAQASNQWKQGVQGVAT